MSAPVSIAQHVDLKECEWDYTYTYYAKVLLVSPSLFKILDKADNSVRSNVVQRIITRGSRVKTNSKKIYSYLLPLYTSPQFKRILATSIIIHGELDRRKQEGI
jgi:hypothetical protein